jgi:hypothetical protein
VPHNDTAGFQLGDANNVGSMKIDNLRIYTTALTAKDIVEIYEEEISEN